MTLHGASSHRLIAFLILLALVFSQLAMSVHAAIHSDHISVAGYEHDKSSPSKSTKHKCSECLFAKVMHAGWASAELQILVSFFQKLSLSLSASNLILNAQRADYQSRAPPIFLA
jgi:hypothetical protein